MLIEAPGHDNRIGDAMIRPVSYAEIFNAPNAKELFAEYADECGVHDGEPQVQAYANMEAAGKVQGFGAFVAGELIGFTSVLVGVNPHHGNTVAAIDSLFVAAKHRRSTAGNDLLAAAERHATEVGSMELVYTARRGSALDKVLSRRAGCQMTHVMYTKRLVVS